MIDKETSFPIINSKIITFNSYGFEKTASTLILPEDYDPDFLYVLVRSISAGEYFGCNNNSDYFNEVELREGYPTFLDAHVFTNHQNKDVANAIGSILKAEWVDRMKYVELLLSIDRKVAPNVVRGFEKRYTTDVSMGCRVKYTVCSICGNKARTRAEYCDHVKKQRGVIFPDGRKVFEYNFGPRFHDLSIVLNGADKTAKFIQIVLPEASLKEKPIGVSKVAMDFNQTLEKVASDIMELPTVKLEDKCHKINKIADIQKEIIDRLYIMALLERIPDEILTDGPTDIDKSAAATVGGTLRNVRNVGLGVLGLALATNYLQGKRLRGEDTNKVENFIADNPGTLPVAYAAGYPKYMQLKNMGMSGFTESIKSNLNTAKDFISNNKFLKKASEIDLEANGVIDVFNNKDINQEFKEKLSYDDNQLNLIKAAIIMEFLDKNVDFDKLGTISEHDTGKFLKFSLDKINEHLDKEASLMKTFLEFSLSNPGPKVPSGLLIPSTLGLAVDAALFSKFLFNEGKKGQVKNQGEVNKALPNLGVPATPSVSTKEDNSLKFN